MITWLRQKENQYKVATVVLLFLVLYLYWSSMKKDFTYEKAMMEIKFRDEKNTALQDLRGELNEAKAAKVDAIRLKELQDSMVDVNSHTLDNAIRALRTEKNSYEKYKAIDDFGSDELREYYRKLPKHNDYR